MTSSSPLPTLLPLNAKPAERRITSRPSSAPLSARALRETNSQSKSSGKEVTVLTRERDELRVRYQHLQGLLREAQQTVTKQAAEIKALRRALAEGSTGNVDEDDATTLISHATTVNHSPIPSTEPDGSTIEQLRNELEQCKQAAAQLSAELERVRIRCQNCPRCHPRQNQDCYPVESNAEEHVDCSLDIAHISSSDGGGISDHQLEELILDYNGGKQQCPRGSASGDVQMPPQRKMEVNGIDCLNSESTGYKNVDDSEQPEWKSCNGQYEVKQKTTTSNEPATSVADSTTCQASMGPLQQGPVSQIEKERDALEEELIYMYEQLRHAKDVIRRLQTGCGKM